MNNSIEWFRRLRKTNNELRKSYVYWHMPSKKRLRYGWKDKDHLAVTISFHKEQHHEQSITLTSGGSFRIDKDVAVRLEELASKNAYKDVRFVAYALERMNKVEEDFAREVNHSLASSSEERRNRLKQAPIYPEVRLGLVSIRKRNADVVAEVLTRAKGRCEVCRKAAPFQRDDGSHYLEVHHKVWLAHKGPDTVDNAIALCPNCHREAHFGQQAQWSAKLSKVGISV